MGNSRVEIGIDPAHRCFADAGMEAYNLGVPGAEVRRQLAYALNAMDGRAVDHVFLSVDFTDFIWSGRWPPEPAPPMGEVDSGDFPRFPSGAKNPRYLHSVVRDYYRSLFSLDALTSSLRTVALQSDTAPDRDARGFNPGRDYAELVRVEGPRALFDQKMDELRARYRGAWYLREGPASEFADLEWFLGLAREKGIRVTLFTNPFHREYWQLLSERGLLDLHRQWKTQLQALAARHPGAVAALWDFFARFTLYRRAGTGRRLSRAAAQVVLGTCPLPGPTRRPHDRGDAGAVLRGGARLRGAPALSDSAALLEALRVDVLSLQQLVEVGAVALRE